MYQIKIISTLPYEGRELGFFQVKSNLSGKVAYHFYYRSTGQHSKRAGEWFPFAGIATKEDHLVEIGLPAADFISYYPYGWIIKMAGIVGFNDVKKSWTEVKVDYVGDRHNFPRLSEKGIHPALIAHIIKQGELPVHKSEWIYNQAVTSDGARAWYEWCLTLPGEIEK